MKSAVSNCLIVSAALALAPMLYASQQTPTIHALGTTSFKQASTSSINPALASSAKPMKLLRPLSRPQIGASKVQAPAIVAGPKFAVAGTTPGEFGFVGIDSLTNSQAIGFTLEPPDQGLASNGSEVFETVNLSVQVYANSGTPLTPVVGLAQFFGASPNGNLSDPRVFFDPHSQRFFLTALEYFFDPNTGFLLGSVDLLAVSATSDALGSYYLYAVDACSAFDEACLGDQPLTGVNEDGFYLSSNDFGNFSFDGAFVVALDKNALITGSSTVSGTAYLLPNDFSVEPALPAPGADSTENTGTEYFTESLDFGGGGNTLRLYALTNTESLSNLVPTTSLATNDFPTEAYSNPVPATQKVGPYPLGQALGSPEEQLDTNDDRMLQLYYGNGKLYTTLETQLTDPNPKIAKSGGAWFIIEPSMTANALNGHVISQGYLGIQGASILFPAFAVDNKGNGVIGFSFCGGDYYPSAGYVRVTAGAVEQTVHLARPGEGPEDGFSGYPALGGGGVARWGDYSAATMSPDGHVWFAAEYIASRAAHRTPYTNWSTFIAQVN